MDKNWSRKKSDHEKIQFWEGSVWIVKAQSTWVNPYYFMKDNSIFWEIQWWNKTYNLNLPSMDYAFFLNHNIYSGWDNDLSSFLIIYGRQRRQAPPP